MVTGEGVSVNNATQCPSHGDAFLYLFDSTKSNLTNKRLLILVPLRRGVLV